MSNGKKICLGYGGCARICYRGAMQEPSVRTSRLAIAGGLAAILVVGGGGFFLGRTTAPVPPRSEEHTSELQSLMRISYAVFCLKKKNKQQTAFINPLYSKDNDPQK